MTFPLHQAHTDAFVALVTAVFAATPVKVGDGEEPANVGWVAGPGGSNFVGHVTVYPVNTDPGESSIVTPWSDAEFEWQTTIVSASRKHGQTIFDLLAQALVDQQIVVTGRACSNHLRLTTDGGGVRREETSQPPLWVATPRWAITTVPA